MNMDPSQSTVAKSNRAPARNIASGPRRIVIDCTNTVKTGLKTGIQRVVRSLVREGHQLGQTHGQAIMGAVLGPRGFEQYCPGKLFGAHVPPPTLRDNVLYHLPRAYVRTAERLCRRVKSHKVRRLLLPESGHLGIFKLPIELIDRARKLRGSSPRPGDLRLDEGDMLILADACWGVEGIWDYVRQARANGTFVATVIYDIISQSHPQLFMAGMAPMFRNHLREVIAQSDLILAISQTVRDQLRQELPELFPDAKRFPPIDYFVLGADFAKQDEAVRPELADLFTSPHRPTPYLSVSTIEPRKNHGFTLQAFELLWSRAADVRLVFVGRQGWLCEDFLRYTVTHREFGKRLFLFHDLTDTEVAFCNQHARGSINASLVEGFGLPIVESLWYGRKTFVSDIPVFREVGGDQVVYFKLASPEWLVRAIAHWEFEIATGASIEQRRVTPLSWRESTEMLLHKARAAYAKRNGSDEVSAERARFPTSSSSSARAA